MNIKVLRQLSNGTFKVRFEPSDFSEEERKKFASFGIPTVQLQIMVGRAGGAVAQIGHRIAITEISKYSSQFATEEEARSYEAEVLGEIKSKMQELRERKDEFTATEDIAL